MYIRKISNSDCLKQTSFNGTTKPLNKIFNPENIEEQIQKIAANGDTKDIFKGLTAIAASLITGFAVYTETDKEARNFANGLLQELNTDENQKLKNKLESLFDKQTSKETEKNEIQEFDFDKLKEEKPEREVYLKMTSYFQNLDEQYKNLLKKHIQDPDNEKNNFVLSSIENIFKMFSSSNEKLMLMTPYLKVLNDKYSSCLEGIAENLSSAIANGNSPMYYLVLLRNETLTEEDIKRWAKNKNLGCDEFMFTRELSDDILNKINRLKETNQNFSIKYFRELEDSRDGIKTYAFKLNFSPEDLPLSKMLKTAAEVHEAIYGKIYIQETKDSKDVFLVEDIQTELVDNILKDRSMDSTYNFVKYIDPSALSEFNYTSDDIKFLAKDDPDFGKIKSICSHVLMNLDFKDPKLTELCEVINDENLFKDVFATRHSRIRFLTRFVLKDNYSPANLKEDTYEKINLLYDELRENAKTCNYFAYNHPKGTAPQFYIRKSKLGNFVKVTLNSNGSIHTIYEDFNKELKKKNED